MTADSGNTAETLDPTQPGARAHLRECPSGAWIVHDDANRRGGRFADRRSAVKFVRREFGANSQIIAQKPLATANTRRLSNTGQRRMAQQIKASR